VTVSDVETLPAREVEASPADEAVEAKRGAAVGSAALDSAQRRAEAASTRVACKTRASGAKAIPKSSAQPHPSLDVGAEVALLDSARQAISRGDTAVARQRLAEYERRFPKGVLRRDARVLYKAAAAVDSP